MFLEVFIKLARSVTGFDLPVAKHVANGQQVFFEDFETEPRVLARPVVAIREVKRVYVPVRRRVIGLDNLLAELVGRADQRAPRLARPKESVFIDFARGG